MPSGMFHTQYTSANSATIAITPSLHKDISVANGRHQVAQLCQNCSTV
jgi:hypothetical protein